MGPLIASRHVAQQIHEQIFDDEFTIWFVAQAPDGAVQGFCTAHIGKSLTKLLYDWTADGEQSEKVTHALCDARYKYLSDDHATLPQTITTHVKPIIEQLKGYGFVRSHQKGQFSVLHSTVVRQKKTARKEKLARVKTSHKKTFHPAPKPSKVKG